MTKPGNLNPSLDAIPTEDGTTPNRALDETAIDNRALGLGIQV